ncbi:hypothetical protein AZ22_3674 [Bordetella bronchiseptica 980-2]|nr:hypothetical protein AZ22_3674 [Bordetella bronchiseptica 980-2]KCV51153.1 hypothetical protein L491_3715 [Bordetella bronchiseptica 3E44]KDB86093.1 hypothetical protein AZ27_3612 [Bordetella bronchiseptica D756]KDB88515.1 hypothetical protein AZ17_3790 [Bordetella bronchiseptica D989]KDD54288.1 hypothetical protein L534_3717 [Bordetella bronchiseptica RB630]KDD64507.1 hypothetical protein L533_3847 [Bordetella bronchiseptica OSU553]
MIRPTDNSPDAAAMALKGMYDLYGVCAGRFVDYVDHVNRPRESQ